MAQQDWFILRNGKQFGPCTSQQLKKMVASGELLGTDQVRRGDMPTPITASKIKGLFPEASASDSRSHPPTPKVRRPLPAEKKELRPPEKAATSTPIERARPYLEGTVAIAVSLILCFPLGLVLLWLNRGWSRAAKWKWTGAVVGCLALLMVLSSVQRSRVHSEITKAHALWDSGDKAKAVAIYRPLLGADFAFVEDHDRPLIYGRTIDFEVANGNEASAQQLARRAAAKGIVPSADSPAAKILLANIQAEGAEKANKESRPDVDRKAERNFDIKKLIAEIEAKAPPVPVFPASDYEHDFTKDDYSTIPAGAKRDVRKKTIDEGDKDLINKTEMTEGYVTSSGRFIKHGALVIWTDATESKKYQEAKYLDGTLHGIRTFYYLDGKIDTVAPYVDGARRGTVKSWHKNGKAKAEVHFIKDAFHGRRRLWYENGDPELDEIWVKGKLHGISKRWFKDGRLASICCFNDGKRNSKVWSQNEDGSLGETGEWENGRPKGRCRFQFADADNRPYYIEVGDERWIGGTIAEFIASMHYHMLRDRPDLGLQFGPKTRIANYVSPSSADFFSRFGSPSQDVMDFEKAPLGAPDFIRDRYRVWTYSCRDGVLRLRAQPTQSGNLLVTAHWRDNPQ
jgi:antitoxin component YwqK of YwqJK toxin-antitoxin module